MTKRNNYPRLRNGKLEGGGLFKPHIFLEEKKQIWVLCESSITAMGISSYVRDAFPEYAPHPLNRQHRPPPPHEASLSRA